MLSWEVNLGMDDAHMPSQSIVAAECFLFHAKRAADLLLAYVVNCVFVASEIVRPRKHRIAGLPGGRIYALALMRPLLRISRCERS